MALSRVTGSICWAGGSIRCTIILNHARSGFCSTQTSSPVSGSVTFCLSKCFLPRAMAMAVVPNSRWSPSSSISPSKASLIRLPWE